MAPDPAAAYGDWDVRGYIRAGFKNPPRPTFSEYDSVPQSARFELNEPTPLTVQDRLATTADREARIKLYQDQYGGVSKRQAARLADDDLRKTRGMPMLPRVFPTTGGLLRKEAPEGLMSPGTQYLMPQAEAWGEYGKELAKHALIGAGSGEGMKHLIPEIGSLTPFVHGASLAGAALGGAGNVMEAYWKNKVLEDDGPRTYYQVLPGAAMAPARPKPRTR
jgi:hypothetical protein